MIELWAGSIVATIAGCICAAWGPKALLKTIAALAMALAAVSAVVVYAEVTYQQQEYVKSRGHK